MRDAAQPRRRDANVAGQDVQAIGRGEALNDERQS
jgi:hypothetical protein